MPYQEIDFVSQSEMHHLEGRADTIVISIRNPQMPPARVAQEFRDTLFLEFDNVEHLSRHAQRFTRAQAKEILDFVAKHDGQATRIVVNCLMGETRSAAVARFLADKYGVSLAKPTDKSSPWVYKVLEHSDEFDTRPKA